MAKTSKEEIMAFMAHKTLAVAGASRSRAKFGNMVYRDLRAKGYHVLAINPNAAEVEGDKCYANLSMLPEPVEGLVCVTPPAITEQLVREAAKAGITHVWLQQGSESKAAIEFCQLSGMRIVTSECILMYQPNPAWFHKAHRFVKGVFGG